VKTPDELIWEHAKLNQFIMNYSTEIAAALIRRFAIAIVEFEGSRKPLLVLRRE
jgi:hypothetical protein